MGLLRLFLLIALGYLIYRWWRSVRLQPRPQPQAETHTSADPSTPRPAHEILGVPQGASPAEIHAAYQRLIKQYHPDRVADMGPEIRDVAERRAKEINGAYEQLRRS